tara:strand:- start:750 stop:965 length:216 start_codon:yes stop_codon:yes gene_type:complete
MLKELSFCFLILTLLTACSKTSEETCKSEIKLIACTKEYMPVCGCDNVTYSNKCVAESHGLNIWANGACNT